MVGRGTGKRKARGGHGRETVEKGQGAAAAVVVVVEETRDPEEGGGSQAVVTGGREEAKSRARAKCVGRAKLGD